MSQLHLHLLSDSTGETLEMIAKACLAQFDEVEAMRHFWPMVRSEGHLDRVLDDIERRPGLVLYTLVNATIRARARAANAGAAAIHAVSVLDPVIDALSAVLRRGGQGPRPGRQHALDAAYFARVDAIQFTIAHDDGIGFGELGGGRHRPRRRVAHLEDADQHLSRQSRLQGRQHPAGAGSAAAADRCSRSSIRWSSA